MEFFLQSSKNWFRLFGDALHVIAILTLLVRILSNRSSKGISVKSQCLLAAMFLARYADLWFSEELLSYYNGGMKMFYISSSLLTVYLVVYCYPRSQEESKLDNSSLLKILTLVSIATWFFHYETTVIEILWSWSIFLEAVALFPQYIMIYNSHHCDANMLAYLSFHTLYRGFYILNWIYRYKMEGHLDPISIIGGLTQTFVNLVCLLSVISLMISNMYNSPAASSGSGNRMSSVYVIPALVDYGKKPELKLNHQSSPEAETERCCDMTKSDHDDNKCLL